MIKGVSALVTHPAQGRGDGGSQAWLQLYREQAHKEAGETWKRESGHSGVCVRGVKREDERLMNGQIQTGPLRSESLSPYVG